MWRGVPSLALLYSVLLFRLQFFNSIFGGRGRLPPFSVLTACDRKNSAICNGVKSPGLQINLSTIFASGSSCYLRYACFMKMNKMF